MSIFRNKKQAPRRTGSRNNIKQYSIKFNSNIMQEFDKVAGNRTEVLEELMRKYVCAAAKKKGVMHSFNHNVDTIDL